MFFFSLRHVIHPFLGKIACLVAQVIKGYVCNGAMDGPNGVGTIICLMKCINMTKFLTIFSHGL